MFLCIALTLRVIEIFECIDEEDQEIQKLLLYLEGELAPKFDLFLRLNGIPSHLS